MGKGKGLGDDSCLSSLVKVSRTLKAKCLSLSLSEKQALPYQGEVTVPTTCSIRRMPLNLASVCLKTVQRKEQEIKKIFLNFSCTCYLPLNFVEVILLIKDIDYIYSILNTGKGEYMKFV